MCLFKKHWFPKFSKTPITVYKRLEVANTARKAEALNISEGFLYTPVQFTEVTLGQPIKAKRHWIFGLLGNTIGAEGVHAYTNIKSCVALEGENYYKAIIPPYTAYWIGRYGDIAASEMIVTEKYEEKK